MSERLSVSTEYRSRSGIFRREQVGVLPDSPRRRERGSLYGNANARSPWGPKDGINFGWRFVFAESFYATAWLGLSRPLGREPVTLAESTYEGQAITVFPAVHLGYRFR